MLQFFTARNDPPWKWTFIMLSVVLASDFWPREVHSPFSRCFDLLEVFTETMKHLIFNGSFIDLFCSRRHAIYSLAGPWAVCPIHSLSSVITYKKVPQGVQHLSLNFHLYKICIANRVRLRNQVRILNYIISKLAGKKDNSHRYRHQCHLTSNTQRTMAAKKGHEGHPLRLVAAWMDM